MIGIYKITNMVNGKVYIGQSVNIEKRWQTHATKYNNPKNKEYNKVLYCAMRKHGFENFEFEILMECEEELLDLMEIYYIEKYNSYIHAENSNGYNIDKGGYTTKGLRHTKKTKKKLSIIAKERFKNKENHPFYGRHHSEENKKKFSESHKKENLSKETLEKMRNSALGRKHTEEAKKKMSEARKGNISISEKTYCDGILFNSIFDCAEYMGEKYGTVKECVSGRNAMPKEWYDRGLRLETKEITDYTIAKRTLRKKVFYNGMIFNSIKIVAQYCNKPRTTINSYLTGRCEMPNEFKDLGLRYATKEDVQKYPVYDKDIK